jgi:peptidoglycan L-alanyl-D-glutamate endopeptidase CwlK
MPNFSEKSFKRLNTCDIRLVTLFREVVHIFDCTVLEGERSRETQEKYFEEGKTKLHWPNSKHNVVDSFSKSKAIDVIPFPVDWRFEKDIPSCENYVGTGQLIDMDVVHNIERWFMFIGIVKGIAHTMKIPIISGADWDGDNCMADQKFDDLPHFELID